MKTLQAAPGRHRSRRAAALVTSLGALVLAGPLALAGPGAHGPNGEHLDAPAASLVLPALPRLETATEAFELVAELRAGELVILVDRYETNEPVLGATLEVESGALKAVADYRTEQGDYVVSDPALLQALARPGEHPLVFTLLAGEDSDLLDATLVSAGGGHGAGDDHGHDDHAHGHAHTLEYAAWVGGGLLALGLVGGLVWRGRRGAAQGSL